MKSLFLAAFAAVLCVFAGTAHNLALAGSMVSACPKTLAGDSIVMEDAILMMADTENDAETISSIEISQSGQIVLSIQGCGQKVCKVDLSSLGSGTYLAEVATNLDRVFSDYVTVQ